MLRAGLRRKGVPPAALREYAERVGVSKADAFIESEVLEDCVRDVLDESAARAFGVLRPLALTVTDWSELDEADEALEAPRHPKKDFGMRPLRFGSDLVIERTDFHDLQQGDPPKGFNRLVEGGRVRERTNTRGGSMERPPSRLRRCWRRRRCPRISAGMPRC